MSKLQLVTMFLMIGVPSGLWAQPQKDETAPSAPARKPDAALALEAAMRRRLKERMPVLDLDLAMFGEDFFGAEPGNIRWSDDGSEIYFDWKRYDEVKRGTWRFTLATESLERLAEEVQAPPRSVKNRDRTRRAWIDGQAIFVAEGMSQEGREVYRGARSGSELVFSADGHYLYLVSREGVSRLSLDEPGFRELIAIKRGKEPKDEDEDDAKKGESPADLLTWHKDEQRSLFRVLFERAEREREEKKNRRALKKSKPMVTEIYVAEEWEVSQVSLSPTGCNMVLSLSKEKKKGRVAEMPDYVTNDGFTKMHPTRPKVGDGEREIIVEVVNVATGVRTRVQDIAPDCGAAPFGFQWSPDGAHLIASAASRNDEHAWLFAIDSASGKTSVLHHLIDPAWVLQHGFSVQWLGTRPSCVFVSEACGTSHLYRADLEDQKVTQLTKGRFEVQNFEAKPDGSSIIAVATPTSPFIKDLVEVDPESGELMVLTAETGGRTMLLSPDGERSAEVFSTANHPPELRIRWLNSERPPITVTDSPSPAFKSFSGFEAPPIIKIKASDGREVPARIYRPKDTGRPHPAVLFVHGAGYLQNVHQWWSHYSREYVFHHILRDEGFTVLDLDYRGSAGYGRDWRTAIKGHMGGRDLDDYVEAVDYLVANENVARDRIGIYGGSYGGFITLMGLFTHPGVFKAGAALRPVTDWAHYNDGYTSNILDTPLESAEDYRRSSPIYLAEGLQDRLLICHGLVDDNVHVQDTVRLTQRLIELRKTNFEVAYYPLEAHGFRDAASWTDEYRRIHRLFLETLAH